MRRRGPQPVLWDGRTDKLRDYLFAWQGGALRRAALNKLITRPRLAAGIPRLTSHTFRHTIAVQWRRNGMRIETISSMLGHRDLKMTLRYAAVMPMTLRREFDQAFAAIDEEHRVTPQVRVMLSPEAHIAAATAWREYLWVDLGIGLCSTGNRAWNLKRTLAPANGQWSLPWPSVMGHATTSRGTSGTPCVGLPTADPR